MSNISAVKKVLILVMILALPGFLYYLLTAEGKNRYMPLPFFGPKQLAKTSHKFHGKVIPDTIYHKLPDFKLTDQNGEAVTAKNFDDKIFVASFFYTHCPSVCNIINKNVNALLSDYAKNNMVCFASITVDPQRDSVSVLHKYSQQYKPPGIKWLFLTGDTSVIYPLARKGFLVDAVKVDNDNFIYSDKLILIDKEKRIRGYYSGTSTKDITKLNDEIKVLIAEELRKNDKPLY
ncbi:SCO family protein [Mucilaginibacter corticis]|uniref:SCO family protein n=1 Tax=Mucilaginibacter corticis TaxID=2597670 RepID=UPI001FE5E9ED|nr:SCO family protein [Mucilaginibacter corticis]